MRKYFHLAGAIEQDIVIYQVSDISLEGRDVACT